MRRESISLLSRSHAGGSICNRARCSSQPGSVSAARHAQEIRRTSPPPAARCGGAENRPRRRRDARGVILEMARQKIQIIDERFAQRAFHDIRDRPAPKAHSPCRTKRPAPRRRAPTRSAAARPAPPEARSSSASSASRKVPGVSDPVPSSSGMPSRRNSSATPSASALASGKTMPSRAQIVALQIIERLQDDRANVRGQVRRHAETSGRLRLRRPGSAFLIRSDQAGEGSRRASSAC